MVTIVMNQLRPVATINWVHMATVPICSSVI
jgi:hypothetical protein